MSTAFGVDLSTCFNIYGLLDQVLVAAMRGRSALGAAIVDERNTVSTISDGVVHLTALEFGTRLHVLPISLTTADLKCRSVGVGVGIAAVLIGHRALFGVGSN
jgi:hypothetical protein